MKAVDLQRWPTTNTLLHSLLFSLLLTLSPLLHLLKNNGRAFNVRNSRMYGNKHRVIHLHNLAGKFISNNFLFSFNFISIYKNYTEIFSRIEIFTNNRPLYRRLIKQNFPASKEEFALHWANCELCYRLSHKNSCFIGYLKLHNYVKYVFIYICSK